MIIVYFLLYNYIDILVEGKSMKLETDIIIYIIKMFTMNIYVYYSFKKMMNIKQDNIKRMLVILTFNIILSFFSCYVEFFINSFSALLVTYVIYGVVLGIETKIKSGTALIATLISYAICAILFFISAMLSYLMYYLTSIENKYITLAIMLVLQGILLYRIFKIKKFKNGFAFLNKKSNNDYIDIIIINIGAVIVIVYCLFGTIYDEITKNLFIALFILGISMFAIIQKTFTMYYKQKLLKDTIIQYENELKGKDNEIKKLSKEKYEISRLNHEFYNRQKALELKVKNLGVESGEELGILDRINDLSKEYSENLEEIKGKPKLPLTNIPEIDDMFEYMQIECIKNKIDFKLHIEGDIYYLINDIIPKNKLETLIGDHIRNAIIAINFSENKNKSILVMLGIKENCYELSIYDSGIEFEIETLKKLGLERATTHKETGGSGIGFMTTFETLKECKASLIIEEKNKIEENNYTKAIKIRFDGKHQYKIISYRGDKIKQMIKDKRVTINNLKQENREYINTNNTNNSSNNINICNSSKTITK